VLALADRHIKRHDARYPVGRARLEALGVLGCATIMSMAAVEVIQFSVRQSCVKCAAQKNLPHDVASV
jgi:divalent metal cation (Fe/Co/Zn/Cd) transporter